MRCVMRKLALVSAALMIMSVSALAEEGAMGNMLEQGQQAGKDECLLVSLNCANQVDTIQQKIDRIQAEIARGTVVYSTDELKKLNIKLEDAIKIQEDVISGG